MNWFRAVVGTKKGLRLWSRHDVRSYPPQYFDRAFRTVMAYCVGVRIAGEYNNSGDWSRGDGGMQITAGSMQRNFGGIEWEREDGA